MNAADFEKGLLRFFMSRYRKERKREDDLLLLLQTALLLDNRHEGREYKNISAASCLAYAENVRSTYDEGKKNLLLGVVEYLDEAFPAKIKFLHSAGMKDSAWVKHNG